MILKIKTYPDPVLKKKAEKVKEINEEIKSLIRDMFETMYDSQGIGLAAPQVGISKQIVVVAVSDAPRGAPQSAANSRLERAEFDSGRAERGAPQSAANSRPEQTFILINPKILKKKGKILFEEGCLSVPGIYLKIKRAKEVVVGALNEKGEKFQLQAQGLLAVCLQQEIDHLQGILIIDRIPLIEKIKLKFLRKI